MPTVLLVEDDICVLHVVRQMLQKQGYAILEASGTAEALGAADGFPARIDLLITDVVLPREGSNRLVEQLRAGRPDLKVLYISGYSRDALARYGIDQTERNFLPKPFTMDTLERKIREVLGKGERVRGAGAA